MSKGLALRIGRALLTLTFVMALSDITGTAPISHAQGGDVQSGLDTLAGLVQLPSGVDARTAVENTLIFAISFVTLLATVAVVAAGIMLIASGGSETVTQRARKMIIYAIIGLLVIFFSALIVSFFTVDLPGQF